MTTQTNNATNINNFHNQLVKAYQNGMSSEVAPLEDSLLTALKAEGPHLRGFMVYEGGHYDAEGTWRIDVDFRGFRESAREQDLESVEVLRFHGEDVDLPPVQARTMCAVLECAYFYSGGYNR